MATFEQHCRECEAELGDRFEHVHRWLDELQPEYGPMHRVFRHHTEGVDRVRGRWGETAAHAAELHIRRDTGGSLPTPGQLRREWDIDPDAVEPEPD